MIILSNGQPHYIGKPFVPDIEVIARALAHINRFTGHGGTYSVAQHCVLMSARVERHLAFSALMHDAPEAYIGDVSAPLKAYLPEYRKLEDFYHGTIDRHYGVDTRSPGIKAADLRMLDGRALSQFPFDSADSTNVAINTPKTKHKFPQVSDKLQRVGILRAAIEKVFPPSIENWVQKQRESI